MFTCIACVLSSALHTIFEFFSSWKCYVYSKLLYCSKIWTIFKQLVEFRLWRCGCIDESVLVHENKQLNEVVLEMWNERKTDDINLKQNSERFRSH